MARKLAADGIKSRYAATRFRGIGKVLASTTPRAPPSSCSRMEISRRPPPVFRRRPAQARAHRLCGGGPAGDRDFYCRVWLPGVDWIEDFFVFLRWQPDHHTVISSAPQAQDASHRFEMKDFAHMQHACELLGVRKIRSNWGPVRHGPGHNVAIYHRNFDDQNVEFYIELDQMKDEELGYFDPRPGITTRRSAESLDRRSPQPLGPLPMPDFMRDRPRLGLRQAVMRAAGPALAGAPQIGL